MYHPYPGTHETCTHGIVLPVNCPDQPEPPVVRRFDGRPKCEQAASRTETVLDTRGPDNQHSCTNMCQVEWFSLFKSEATVTGDKYAALYKITYHNMKQLALSSMHNRIRVPQLSKLPQYPLSSAWRGVYSRYAQLHHESIGTIQRFAGWLSGKVADSQKVPLKEWQIDPFPVGVKSEH